ncbi:hypodermin-A-like [Drosophila ficusphila]|uniref:hypodermin-A-like n=1 Tax=Drosophila ficusphila TaxID=30025 RepID=UPI001C89E54A|nr:hypodermin-A-like [Drosophila ficusphila]
MFIKSFLLLSAINFLSAGRVPQPEERIIGGMDIEIEDAPWQVAVLLRGSHYCGGSIYNKNIIITAAHCRYTIEGEELKAEDFQVRVGSSLKNRDGTLINVAAIESHEKYNKPKFANDIAVMRLGEPLEFSSTVQPIPLAEKNPAPETLAMTTGWGAVRVIPLGNGEAWKLYPEHLQRVDLRVKRCSNYFSDNSEENICVHSVGQATCSGDSGGPLVVDKQLVGVTSWGLNDCSTFTAFAGVPYFRNWILRAIEIV